jgi:hypothetical protein
MISKQKGGIDMHKYIGTLETSTEPKRIFSYSVGNKYRIEDSLDDIMLAFINSDLTMQFMTPGIISLENINNGRVIIRLKESYITVIESDDLGYSDNVVKEIKPYFRINNFSEDLNYKNIVLEISGLSVDDRTKLSDRLKFDDVGHLYELTDDVNYILIENCDVYGFKFLKDVCLDDNYGDIFVCPLFHDDDEGYYIGDGIIVNITRDARIDINGTISAR